MIFGLENSGENSPIIIYSMIEMSVCLGNEEEDGEEGEDEKHGLAMYSSVMIFGLENSGENSPIIIYSMTEMSVCLGNEEEDGEEGEDEKHCHVHCDDIWFGKYREKQPNYYLFYERDVCVPRQ
jgi:hypothetical protein